MTGQPPDQDGARALVRGILERYAAAYAVADTYTQTSRILDLAEADMRRELRQVMSLHWSV